MPSVASRRDWMFDPVTGAILDVKPEDGVLSSPVSKHVKRLSDLSHIQDTVDCDVQAYRRKFEIEPLLREKPTQEEEVLQNTRTRATTNEACPKCQHQGLEYYTMQLRSADEGQTVFYECLNCKHKYSQNT